MSNDLLLQSILDRLQKLDEKIDDKIDALALQIEAKVTPLNEFRWKTVGASTVSSAIVTIVITITIQVIF
jgi:hypothetical protein